MSVAVSPGGNHRLYANRDQSTGQCQYHHHGHGDPAADLTGGFSFNANPVTIQQGQSAMLSWSETGRCSARHDRPKRRGHRDWHFKICFSDRNDYLHLERGQRSRHDDRDRSGKRRHPASAAPQLT